MDRPGLAKRALTGFRYHSKSNLLVFFFLNRLLFVTITIIKFLRDESDNFVNSLDNTDDMKY